MELEHIKEVSSWDSEGGVILDLIELKDGRVLAISDEVVLYKNMEDLITGDASKTPFINSGLATSGFALTRSSLKHASNSSN